MNIILLIGRIIFGGHFVLMGINHFRKSNMLTGYASAKGIPMARLAVIVSGLFLLFGGLGIVFGVSVKIALLLIIVFLILASFLVHSFWKESDSGSRASEMQGFLKNIALLGATVMLYALFANDWLYTL